MIALDSGPGMQERQRVPAGRRHELDDTRHGPGRGTPAIRPSSRRSPRCPAAPWCWARVAARRAVVPAQASPIASPLAHAADLPGGTWGEDRERRRLGAAGPARRTAPGMAWWPTGWATDPYAADAPRRAGDGRPSASAAVRSHRPRRWRSAHARDAGHARRRHGRRRASSTPTRRARCDSRGRGQHRRAASPRASSDSLAPVPARHARPARSATSPGRRLRHGPGPRAGRAAFGRTRRHAGSSDHDARPAPVRSGHHRGLADPRPHRRARRRDGHRRARQSAGHAHDRSPVSPSPEPALAAIVARAGHTSYAAPAPGAGWKTNSGVVALYAELDDKFRTVYAKARGGHLPAGRRRTHRRRQPGAAAVVAARPGKAVVGRRVSDFGAPDSVDGPRRAACRRPGRPIPLVDAAGARVHIEMERVAVPIQERAWRWQWPGTLRARGADPPGAAWN